MGEIADWIIEQGWNDRDFFDDYDDPSNTYTPARPPEKLHTLLVKSWDHETDKAWLITTQAGNQHWFPFSKARRDGDLIVFGEWLRYQKRMDVGYENTPPPPPAPAPCFDAPPDYLDEVPLPGSLNDYYQ